LEFTLEETKELFRQFQEDYRDNHPQVVVDPRIVQDIRKKSLQSRPSPTMKAIWLKECHRNHDCRPRGATQKREGLQKSLNKMFVWVPKISSFNSEAVMEVTSSRDFEEVPQENFSKMLAYRNEEGAVIVKV